MQWIKWTMMAAVGCLPVLASAEEPAKKVEKSSVLPKIELQIEVQGIEGKPHVLHFGADGKQSEDLAKILGEMAKRIHVKVNAREHEKHGEPDAEVFKLLTDKLADKAIHLVPQRHHQKGTFLGVATSEPPIVLRKQLALPDGMGLVVDHVVPESPAAKAGLKEYDVLQKIDDQLIVNYEQFTVLVRDHKPGDDVKLTVIHEGKPAVLTAKLIEHDVEVAEAGPNERAFQWIDATPGPPTVLWEEATFNKPTPDVVKRYHKLVLPVEPSATTQPSSKPKTDEKDSSAK